MQKSKVGGGRSLGSVTGDLGSIPGQELGKIPQAVQRSQKTDKDFFSINMKLLLLLKNNFLNII